MFCLEFLEVVNNNPEARDRFLRQGANMQISLSHKVAANFTGIFGLGGTKFSNNKKTKPKNQINQEGVMGNLEYDFEQAPKSSKPCLENSNKECVGESCPWAKICNFSYRLEELKIGPQLPLKRVGIR